MAPGLPNRRFTLSHITNENPNKSFVILVVRIFSFSLAPPTHLLLFLCHRFDIIFFYYRVAVAYYYQRRTFFFYRSLVINNPLAVVYDSPEGLVVLVQKKKRKENV
jgi:hypothetical protein